MGCKKLLTVSCKKVLTVQCKKVLTVPCKKLLTMWLQNHLTTHTFQFRNLQFDFPCGSVEISLIMAGTISLAVRGALILFSVD